MKENYLGKKIFYKTHIISKGAPIVLIHGVWGSSSALIEYENELIKKHNVISFDLRGHGKSFRPMKYGDYGLDKFAKDIHDILVKEKIKKAILVGNSFGNFVALEFFKLYPKMVKRMILISPHYNLKKISLTKYTRWVVNFLSLFYKAFPGTKKRINRDYRKYIGKYNKDWDLGRVLPDMYNTGARSSLLALANIYNYSAEDFIDKINVPVYIIHGDEDSIFPIEYAKEMASRIKGSTIEIVKNANHTMILNNFKELKKILNRILR